MPVTESSIRQAIERPENREGRTVLVTKSVRQCRKDN